MADFSQTGPRLVEEKDLYTGPEPPAVQGSFRPDTRSHAKYVATITAALDMLGSRIIVLIAVIAACAMWAYAVFDPQLQRTYAAIAFSLTVFLPAVALYWRNG